MLRRGMAAGIAAAALMVVTAEVARAEVRDADYRGTLVCEELPFTKGKMREAITVTIADGKVAGYTNVVRLTDTPEARPEKGTGTLKGQDITLEGLWAGNGRDYKASYSGTFVRRWAKLKGTQTWKFDGKTETRNCSGVIKRPLRAFLPRKKKS